MNTKIWKLRAERYIIGKLYAIASAIVDRSSVLEMELWRATAIPAGTRVRFRRTDPCYSMRDGNRDGFFYVIGLGENDWCEYCIDRTYVAGRPYHAYPDRLYVCPAALEHA